MAKKNRLDHELVKRGLAENVDQATRYVIAGEIWVNEQRAVKPDEPVAPGADIVRQPGPRYVSRGGLKLEGALADFGLEVEGMICADVGSSTGGFTDCLLQHGAHKVFAIDVGRGQLHWRLRQDDRVVPMERTDARSVHQFPEAIDLVTVDASFISLRALLPALLGWLEDQSNLIALVKPQFEARPAEVTQGGLVRSADTQQRVVATAVDWFEASGAPAQAVTLSKLPGTKGNLEFFIWAVKGGQMVKKDELLADLF